MRVRQQFDAAAIDKDTVTTVEEIDQLTSKGRLYFYNSRTGERNWTNDSSTS